jgi:hypothetical protein
MLTKRTDPRRVDRSTSSMVMASVNLTEGNGLPIEMGEPIRCRGFPVKVTWPPGSADRASIGIFGWPVAQASMRTKKKPVRRIWAFFEIMGNLLFARS